MKIITDGFWYIIVRWRWFRLESFDKNARRWSRIISEPMTKDEAYLYMLSFKKKKGKMVIYESPKIVTVKHESLKQS